MLGLTFYAAYLFFNKDDGFLIIGESAGDVDHSPCNKLGIQIFSV